MFLRIEMSIIWNTTFDHHAVSCNFEAEICVLFESVYFFYRKEVSFTSRCCTCSVLHCFKCQHHWPIPVVFIVTLIKSFKHIHQLKQKCLQKPQVNVCAANNVYSHKSHALNHKKTAKTNKFLLRIHALKNKDNIIVCVAV